VVDNINIDPSVAQQPTLDIDVGGNAGTASADTAYTRAAKMRFGLAGVLGNPTHQDLFQSIIGGQEQSLRNRAAAQWDVNNSQAHTAQIKQAALEGNTETLKATAANLPTPLNPDGVMEHGFSRSWISSLYDTGVNLGNTDFHDAAKEEPDFIAPLGRIGSELIMKNEMVNTALENLHDATQGQSWMGWAWDEAKGFIPGYAEYKLRSNVQGTGFLTGGPLGSNLLAQARQLNAEPPDEFAKDFPRIIKYLQDSDPALATQFAMAVHGQTNSQTALQDAFSVGQFLPLPVAKIALGLRGLLRPAAISAVKDMTESALKTGIKDTLREGSFGFDTVSSFGDAFPVPEKTIPIKAKAAAAAGDVKSAGALRVEAELDEDLKGPANPISRAIEAIPTNFRADQSALADDVGSQFSREQVVRIQEQFGDSMGRLINTVTNTMRTMRVNLQVASKATIEAVQNDMKRRYPGWSNRVFNTTNPIYEPVSNTWFMGMDIWDNDGQLFAREAQAKQHINLLDIDNTKGEGAEIRNKGAGYYIRVYKHVSEDTDVMRDLLIGEDKDRSPKGWLNALIGWARSPEDTMSKTETTGRRLSTYPVNNYIQMVAEEAKRLSDLSQGHIRVDADGNTIPRITMKARAWGRAIPNRKAWQEWKRVLDATRTIPDPTNKNVPGITFKTVGEYERFFMQTVKRLPTYTETEAYFTKNRLDLYDHTMRNMAMYTNKASHGAETINLMGVTDTGLVRSNKFDAIPLKELPKGNFGYYVQDGDNVQGKFHPNYGSMSAFHKEDKKFEEAISQGRLKVYEVWAPEHNPLSGYGGLTDDNMVRYVVSRHVETAPLSWDQVPRRGGGHFDFDYNHYIKQAAVKLRNGDKWYMGDTTIMPVTIRKMGQDIATKLNQVRIHLLRGDEEAAKSFAQANLPTKWHELRSWFISEGKEAPMLSLDEPIQVVPKDTMIWNHDSSLAGRVLRNGMREGSKNMQFQVNYTGERDARGMFTYKDIGTRNNPIYQVAPAEMVDPIQSMNRGLNRIIHSTFMNDYKRYAAQHWLKEVEGDINKGLPGYMNATEAPFIKSAPFYYFNQPDLVFAKGTPIDFKNNMMSNWHKIQQFIGQPSAFDTYIHAIEQHLQDVTYDKMGPKGAVIPTWLIGRVVKDPVQLVRKMAYHAYLGLFNPAQWLVQNQTWTNIWAISPKSAPAGVTAHMLHRWARYNSSPEFLAELDKKAAAMGWRPGEWTEALMALRRTGFEHVEGEQGVLDTPMDYSFIKNDMNNFLSLGQHFFKDGVKNVRLGAWYTAFKEYRNAHPTGKLKETDIQEILNVADRYHANMSRASVSQLQHGVLSIPLQFLTYQMRLAELFMGKRLGDTVQDRMLARGRLVATYSALYGVPIAVGLTGLPLGDDFRKAALDNGYVVGDKWYETAFNDGIPSMAIGHITGNYYDFRDRFGPKGFDFLKEFYNAVAGDQTTQEALGAGPNIAMSTMSGFGHLLWAMTNQQGYDATLSDVLDIAKEVTSVRQGWKLFEAARLHQWLSTHEGLESSNVSLLNAAFMAGSGLQPQFQSDQFLKSQIIKEREEYNKYVMQRYQQEVQRSVRAAQDNNDTLANTFLARSGEWLKRLPPTMYKEAITRAYGANVSVADKIDWSFYIKTVPPGTEQDNLNAFNRQRQLQDQGIR
jgi:hypothetical protein